MHVWDLREQYLLGAEVAFALYLVLFALYSSHKLHRLDLPDTYALKRDGYI